MTDIAPTAKATLVRAREIAIKEGLHYVYTGNVHDTHGGTTFCPSCAKPLIVRDWHEILAYHVSAAGRCAHCDASIAGVFEQVPGLWGRRRVPIRVRSSSTLAV